jgi:hypothetical protein
MKNFSVKSIGLYGLAIGSAIVFFQIVTSYGEANLKAPTAVTGNYLITLKNLSGCLQRKSLLMNLKQSGIYLNASLTAIEESDTAKVLETIERLQSTNTRDVSPTLSGRLLIQSAAVIPDRNFRLSGLLPVTTCPQSSPVEITGSLAEILTPKNPRQLTGQLSIFTPDHVLLPPVEFTGSLIRSKKSVVAH